MTLDSECGFKDKSTGCMVGVAELQELPLFHQQVIPDSYLDAMGHVNVRWYMVLFDEASWRFFATHGIDEAYIRERRLGGMALKHHIQYLAELNAGESVAVHTRFLGRSKKRIHFMHFLINETTGKLSATLESLGTHADMERRRSAEVPPDIAARMDATLYQHLQLHWTAPLCGAIDV